MITSTRTPTPHYPSMTHPPMDWRAVPPRRAIVPIGEPYTLPRPTNSMIADKLSTNATSYSVECTAAPLVPALPELGFTADWQDYWLVDFFECSVSGIRKRWQRVHAIN